MYTTGSIKQDPDSKAVAIRTAFPDVPDFADRQWGVMTVSNGGHYATNEQVAEWADVGPVSADSDPSGAQ